MTASLSVLPRSVHTKEEEEKGENLHLAASNIGACSTGPPEGTVQQEHLQ